jgi:hypothetical protein
VERAREGARLQAWVGIITIDFSMSGVCMESGLVVTS